MSIFQYFDTSTATLPPHDLEILERETLNLRIVDHGYGWWVNVPCEHDDISWQDFVRQAKQAKLSVAFIHVIRYARQQHCNWVNFDRDGCNNEYLPEFD